VRQWWSRQPDANIGTPTGLTFDVFDVDPEGLDELFLRYSDDDAAVVTTGPCARTPRGGVHLYYQPTGLGNKTGFRPGWDWRGLGGYVLLPWSVGANGVTYAWHEENGVTFDLDRPLPSVPGWLQALLDPPATQIKCASALDLPARPTTSFWSKYEKPKSPQYAAAALENEARNVSGAVVGKRNDQLFQSTYTLTRLEDLDVTVMTNVMLAAAIDAGLPEREAMRTIRSAIDTRGVA